MVAQQTFDPGDYQVENATYATFRGELALPAEAQGVIRLTVFDETPTPPAPIAERLVYRRVGQQLTVRFTPDAVTFAPGQSVQLDLTIRDEHDAPVPAALGIAIVDDAVLNLADDKSTRMPTYFHLLTELDSPDQLEDANFYLSDKPESVAALDSLLGTQGWRRFTQIPAMQFAQGRAGGFGGGRDLLFRETGESSRYRSAAWAEETAFPLSTATTMDVRKTVARQTTRSSRSIASGGWPFALSMIVTSIILLAMVGVASLRWVGSSRSLRAFAAAVALGSLLVGAFSLSMKSLSTDAAPAASGVAESLDESATPIAADDFVELSDAGGAVAVEGFRLRPDETGTLSNMPASAASSEAESSLQLGAVPEAAARYSAPGKQLGAQGNAASEKNQDYALSLERAKKTASPPPEAQPRPEETAEPTKPPGEADAVGGQNRMLAEPPKSLADKSEERLLTREYAKWFYDARTSIPPTDQSSSTIFWHPLFIADETGKATVYFNLPQRPSSFRAIVEAHGANRLGSGDLLINSREP
jgi:hypothetical protein